MKRLLNKIIKFFLGKKIPKIEKYEPCLEKDVEKVNKKRNMAICGFDSYLNTRVSMGKGICDENFKHNKESE